MNTYKKFTKEQLNEVKELAKTKTLKEIASHFNINRETFLLIRKEQPKIESIYQEVKEQKKSRLYSEEGLCCMNRILAIMPLSPKAWVMQCA